MSSTHASTKSPWLFGRSVDLAVFAGAPLAALALVGLGGAFEIREVPAWAFLVAVVGIDVAHVHATLFRVYFDPIEVRRRKALYVGLPIVLYATGVALYAQFGAVGFWRVLAYVAVFHFIRQQVGWTALYRRREPRASRLDASLDLLAIYAATIAPLAHWHAHLPRTFSWFFAGDFIAGLARPIDRIALTIESIVLFVFAARYLQRASSGESLAHGRLLVVAGTALTWYVGIVVCDDDFAFTVTNVIPHGVPYFALAVMYARARYADPRRDASAKFARGLVRAGVSTMIGLLVAVALFEETLWDRLVWHDHESLFGAAPRLGSRLLSVVVPLLALPQFVHYALDGFVWRRRGNPTLEGVL
jgi:hypothetical protein